MANMRNASGVSIGVLVIGAAVAAVAAVAAAPFQGGVAEVGQPAEDFGPGQLDLLRYLEDRRAFSENQQDEHPPRRFSGFGDGGRFLSARRANLLNRLAMDQPERFAKRNIDEIDRTAFDSFFKRNLDEIDRVGWSGFVKRLGNNLDHQRY